MSVFMKVRIVKDPKQTHELMNYLFDFI